MNRKIWIGTLVALMGFSCAGRRVLTESENRGGKQGVVAIWADWVKDKKKKIDVGFNLLNESGGDVIVDLSDMRCDRGGSSGVLKHTFFNTGERTIDLRKGQHKSFNLVCAFGGKTEGPFRIAISRVYANPSGDGRTRGKEIAENLVWELPAER